MVAPWSKSPTHRSLTGTSTRSRLCLAVRRLSVVARCNITRGHGHCFVSASSPACSDGRFSGEDLLRSGRRQISAPLLKVAGGGVIFPSARNMSLAGCQHCSARAQSMCPFIYPNSTTDSPESQPQFESLIGVASAAGTTCALSSSPGFPSNYKVPGGSSSDEELPSSNTPYSMNSVQVPIH